VVVETTRVGITRLNERRFQLISTRKVVSYAVTSVTRENVDLRPIAISHMSLGGPSVSPPLAVVVVEEVVGVGDPAMVEVVVAVGLLAAVVEEEVVVVLEMVMVMMIARAESDLAQRRRVLVFAINSKRTVHVNMKKNVDSSMVIPILEILIV